MEVSSNKEESDLVTIEAIAEKIIEVETVEAFPVASICKGCGVEFTPPPDSSGTARQFRCEKCTGGKAFLGNMAHSCCTVQ